MNFQDFNQPCSMCSVNCSLGSVELTLQNIYREINTIEETNDYLRDLISSQDKIADTDISFNFRSYTYNFDMLCGYCTKPSYNQLISFEEVVLDRVCNLLNYFVVEEITEINLDDLKNVCRGYYSQLWHTIDKVQAIIENNKNKKEND